MNRLRYLGRDPRGAIVRIRYLGLGLDGSWQLVWLESVSNQLKYLGRQPREAIVRLRYLG